MLSRKPYLLRAIYDWIVDSGDTPHIVVDVTRPDVDVPEGYATDGKLVINVSPTATQGLSLANDCATFSARFGGVPHQVMVANAAILAIYARETGQGIVFSEEDEAESEPPSGDDDRTASGTNKADKPKPNRPPHLKVIK